MAAALVGGAFLSASLQILFDRLSSPEVLAYLRGKFKHGNFDELLGKLKSTLLVVTAVLDDAEQKQMRNNPGVDKWLDDLEEAYYDADDLLDEIETDALQLKVETKLRASSSNVCNLSKIKKKFRSLFSKSRSSYGRDMESKIKRILERLEYLKKDMDVFRLQENNVIERLSVRLPSTSLVEESGVYGRDKEKNDIIKLLLPNEEVSSEIGVIPIVGMGGLGKTTLAQLVYNDKRVVDCFEVRVWLCISDQFDVFRVTKTLLQSLPSSSSEDNVTDLNLLQLKLKEKLMGKKFLIVFDDVWNEKQGDWDIMTLPFKGGAQGSKIIMTTRIENVACFRGTVQPLRLGELTEEACWELFAKHASRNRDFTKNPDLERIGKEIVKKCKGLPLAAKTLGSLLHSTSDTREWEKMLKSEIWELTDDRSDILPALRLSYYHLPSQLKRCFAYCAIFPKDYKFEKENLVLLWMAENLLPNSSREKRREEWGEEYFNDLVSRSFFQPSATHAGDFPFGEEESVGNFSFVMHDLMHDLARFVAKEYCLQLGSGNSSDGVKKARHLAFIPTSDDPYKRFNSVSEASHLRTFLPTQNYEYEPRNISMKVVDDLLKLRCLRVFSLSGYQNIVQLPDSIGKQRHLRFLDFSYTRITTLPESVSRLYNLQTLKLYGCASLLKLPVNLHHLINLRNLDIRFCDSLKEIPTQISKLKGLQILSKFIVGRDGGKKIGELKELPDLHGELQIENLENILNPKHALEQAKLTEKVHLETLKLQWSYDGTNDESTKARDALDMLLPNRALKSLQIHQYPGKGFPNWVGCESFANMVFVELSNCRYCSSLPPLGQLPSLKTLYISAFHKVVTVGPEFYGNAGSVVRPFLSLQVLKFSGMSSWKKWIQMEEHDVGTFKKLREFEIVNCDKLIGDLPSFLPSLRKLKVKCEGQLAFSLPRMPSVNDIEVDGCKNEGHIKSLFEALKHMESSPRRLKISNITSSIDISGYLPTTLETLDVSCCKRLEFPLNHQLHKSLQKLHIEESFDSLRSFPLDSFPKLQQLRIYGSEGLESLSVSDGQSPSSLSSLLIQSCPSFVSFPNGGLRAPNLTFLFIGFCNKLKLLPEKMHDHLPSLNTLFIFNCPEIESFPEGGFPFSLSSLYIWHCHKLVASRANWNLQTLPILTRFSIRGGNEDEESFPEEELLPTTIADLYIGHFPRLKALDKNGIQQLTSLKSLYISSCPDLQTIPEEGLPTSLQELSISKCPLLEKKCIRDKGECWNIIDRIFCVTINGEIIS